MLIEVIVIFKIVATATVAYTAIIAARGVFIVVDIFVLIFFCIFSGVQMILVRVLVPLVAELALGPDRVGKALIIVIVIKARAAPKLIVVFVILIIV